MVRECAVRSIIKAAAVILGHRDKTWYRSKRTRVRSLVCTTIKSSGGCSVDPLQWGVAPSPLIASFAFLAKQIVKEPTPNLADSLLIFVLDLVEKLPGTLAHGVRQCRKHLD